MRKRIACGERLISTVSSGFYYLCVCVFYIERVIIMEYKKMGNVLAIRADRGQEILSSIQEICEKENVQVGIVSGIGAVSKCIMGVYDVEEQKYYKNEMDGSFEITNLTGNVTRKDGEVYLHLHITLGDEDGKAFGGHLNEAWISATSEIFIINVEGTLERKVDEQIGLNVLKF